ncbi:DNA-processing protein DprA [Gilvimarinus sp. F26214L]|uniref:DNA-processing protein DprA n=1 Tax=Gilvimarinus sp. DZF01 TaxID=3461371 RepID=UPI0040463147
MDSGSALQEQRANLILSRLAELGPARYWKLRARFGSAHAALHAPPAHLSAILDEPTCRILTGYQDRPDTHPAARQAERDLEWLAENRVHLISADHAAYPELLKTIPQRPPLLYVRGSLANLALPQLALVGSRNPSPGGLTNAFDFARGLARAGFAITSGLALGVDGAAHKGALAASAATIAVLGTGIDTVYPRRHRGLWNDILENGGSIVSEFPLGTGPNADHFPRRNRIISGMSLGVLVVEAAVRSGSLITARYAMQQGREVFAIPGSIHNPMSRGCHALLREGATLVEQIDDLKEPLQGMLAFKWAEAQPDLLGIMAQPVSAEEQHILQALSYEDCALDDLVQRTGMEPGRLLSLLTELELKGCLAQTPGGYARCPSVATSS